MRLNEYRKFVILGNGEYPTSSIPLSILYIAEHVICCDGAAENYVSNGMLPYKIIGDCDSLSKDFKNLYKNIIIQVTDQETNDLTKSVKYLLDYGITESNIVGATGKREDHTLGNISLIMDYMNMGANVRMYTDYGVFIPCHDTCTFSTNPKQQLSIINFDAKGIYSKDLKYPHSDFTKWWQGTLNETISDSVTIEAEGDYLVYINY